ncbi:hypothetical protein FOZ61_008230 [Perkinsus olseni]|uniref:K Homology domain-containing protein n=1 Tax=Perkinsus olseni TaxID=32597 RepID=A0A7J6L5P3_PEROL|nr:hypothetical protein FOZ61_008230 [Perkinsus olseni]KAF4658639.1 hypothetical protein FOL46_006883 [Perkinsus olseni]
MSSSAPESSVADANNAPGESSSAPLAVDTAATDATPAESKATEPEMGINQESGTASAEAQPTPEDGKQREVSGTESTVDGTAGGEKRGREEGAVEATTPTEEPPTKKTATEGGEKTQKTGEALKRDATEVQGSTAETTPDTHAQLETNATEGKAVTATPPSSADAARTPSPAAAVASVESAGRPIGPAPFPAGVDAHHWGPDAGPFRHTVKVPQHCVAQIIGRGGANLMSTRNTTRCHIECDQHTKDSGYSLFHIDAENEQDLQRGIRAIERQTKPMHPLEGEIQQVVIVPDERVGDILGPRGCVVKVISDRTGCRIDIQQRGLQRGEPRECRVVGTAEEVQAGMQMVEGIRDGSVDVKAIIRDFEVANPAFRREQELRSAGGWMSGGKGGSMWDSPYGMRGMMPQPAYGMPGMDPWSHLLPASGPIDRAVVDVPSDCAGLVIGRGGENIKGMQADCSLSECQLEKSVDQRTPRKMTLQGPATGVQAALMQLSTKTNGRIVTIVQQQYPNYQPQQQQQQPMMQQQAHQGPMMQQQGYNNNTGMPPPSQQGYGMSPVGQGMMQGGGGGGMDPMAQYYSQWAAYQQQMNVSNQQNAAAWRNYYASVGNQNPQTPPYRGGQ